MNIYLKSSTIIFSGLIFLSVALSGPAEAQNEARVPEAVSASEDNAKQFLNDGQSGQTAQRGIFQPRGNRLVLQVDDLTEDQIDRIDQLNQKHREEVLVLREKVRNGEIAREVFLEERRTNYENHQQELKKVLTKAQWDQLQKLRAERRRSPQE
jgi:Spy/CpxP family protein refolding chaperone